MASEVVIAHPRTATDVVGFPHAIAGELVTRITAELPAIAELHTTEQVVVAAWLAGLRSPRTRRAYAADVTGFARWCHIRGVEMLAVGRTHVDMWVLEQTDTGAENSSIRRRLAALSSFYTYSTTHGVTDRIPTQGVRRPYVDPDYTATISLDRTESRALIAAVDADNGRQKLRNALVIRLLLHNGLRVDELCQADINDLGNDRGHRVLTVVRKGGKKYKAALAPATVATLDAYLATRAGRSGVDTDALAGPLVATSTGGRMRQSYLWKLIRRLAKTAGIVSWQALSPHSLRHASITLLLDAGGTLRDAQDHAGHADPRTTRRYDHSRGNLDRAGSYLVAGYLAE